MKGYNRSIPFYLLIILPVLIVAGLFVCGLSNYLLFHSLTEIIIIIIAAGLFMVAWNTRHFLQLNHYFLFFCIASMFMAVLNIFHVLSYKGMGIFQGNPANISMQFAISIAYIQSLSLIVAPLYISRKAKTMPIFIIITLIFLLLCCSIFWWNVFPVSYIETSGLTPFMIISNYVILILFVIALVFLFIRKKAFNSVVFNILVASISVSILATIFFIISSGTSGIYSVIAHLFKGISFYLMYVGLLQMSLTKNFNALFQTVQDHEKKFRTLTLMDQVTGVYNRKGFYAIVERHLKLHNRAKGPIKGNIICLVVEINDLQWINHNLGSTEGDKALTDTAAILKKTFRTTDIIARIGSDQFAVFAAEAPENTADIMMKRLDETFAQYKANIKSKYNLTISTGLSTYTPESPVTLDELLQTAYESMIKRKHSQ